MFFEDAFFEDAISGVTPASLVAATKNPADDRVVRMSLTELEMMGLTVTPEDDLHGMPDHAVIPEINWIGDSRGGAPKRRMKELTLKLAELATPGVTST